jgi:hypothetical protein
LHIKFDPNLDTSVFSLLVLKSCPTIRSERVESERIIEKRMANVTISGGKIYRDEVTTADGMTRILSAGAGQLMK